MKKLFLFFYLLICANTYAQDKTESVFIAKPYLQIGNNPSPTTMQLLWHSADDNSVWTVEMQADKNASWVKTAEPKFTTVAVQIITPHKVYNASFTGLKAGGTFKYKVLRDGKEVFVSDAKAQIAADKPYRFVAFADIGAETTVQKRLATQVYVNNPDFVVVPGDIVYDRGLISEYRTKFWPIYNNDKTDSSGAPLMRKIPMISAAGNHDLDTRDLDKFPDALSYFYYWNQPLNGLVGTEGGAIVPPLTASATNRAAFQAAAGDAYLKMANYSFDYGNAHWLVLDSNPYVDLTDKTLQEWIANDLANAKNSTWKFVMYHHPGFNSAREHYEQQQTRLLSPIFEAGKVDVVFNGHVHNYQRTFPMKFTPDKKGVLLVGGMGNKKVRGRVVNGRWTLDKNYNGKTKTTPNGIIYIITGAGGNDLYNPEQQKDPDSWQKFTDKFISEIHSITVADIDSKTMTIRQLDVNGKELDSFKITK
jgi:3',5'-cyclic AMP phosphodiesterase CpdA